MAIKIPLNLTRALRERKGTNQLIQASFTLWAEGTPLIPDSETAAMVGRIVKSAEDQTRTKAVNVVPLISLSAFNIEAPAELVEQILSDSEIKGAELSK